MDATKVKHLSQEAEDLETAIGHMEAGTDLSTGSAVLCKPVNNMSVSVVRVLNDTIQAYQTGQFREMKGAVLASLKDRLAAIENEIRAETNGEPTPDPKPKPDIEQLCDSVIGDFIRGELPAPAAGSIKLWLDVAECMRETLDDAIKTATEERQ